jgi:transcription elongation factor GreA
MDKVPMTLRGQQLLKDELKRLKEVDRPANVKAIEVARGHGDLSENADYDAAKQHQGLLEARIRYLEAQLALANVIDTSKLSGDKVVFGATVKVADTETGDEQTYRIVGEDEADIKQGLISITAPVARAMIGKEVGDTFKVNAPKGPRELEVLSVKFEA